MINKRTKQFFIYMYDRGILTSNEMSIFTLALKRKIDSGYVWVLKWKI